MQKLGKEFQEILDQLYSPQEKITILKGFETQNRLSTFRINTLNPYYIEVLKTLKKNKIDIKKTSGIRNSFSLINLEDEKKLWSTDLIKRGLIYLQGVSSQIPVHFFNFSNQMRVLDLAAAPGGKTSQIAENMENKGDIIALDNNAIRIDKLKFTLKRQGVKNTQVKKIDASLYFNEHQGGLFDAILFDAPCSAEGRVNLSNKKSYHHISVKNNKKYYYIQREILRNNIALLKNGGELIYSTCTLSPIENEAIVHFLLCNFPELEIQNLDTKVFGNLPIKAGISHYGNTAYNKNVIKSMRILPSEISEGFFIAKFKKKSL